MCTCRRRSRPSTGAHPAHLATSRRPPVWFASPVPLPCPPPPPSHLQGTVAAVSAATSASNATAVRPP
eukprot:2952058-Pleurochrysis_carterae.AAC.1